MKMVINKIKIFWVLFLLIGCNQSKKEVEQPIKRKQYIIVERDIRDKKTLDYIDKYSSLAVTEMDYSRIPASVILATAIIASKSGTTLNAVNNKNHFQMKCFTIHSKKEINKHCKLIGKFQYLTYKTVAQSFRENTKSELFTNKNLPNDKDYIKWCMVLRHPKLISLIQEYELDRLDTL